jgi:CubicO group peptidase (beta-lactamase class C family)
MKKLTNAAGMTQENLEALRAKVRAGMKKYKIPGVALGIVHRGKTHLICEGITSISNPQAVTPETLFQIGSTTKTMTGTLIMQLVEQGKLELDAPVRKYLPGLKLADSNVAKRITVRQILNHTGGFSGDILDDTGNGDDALEKYVALLTKTPQVTPLGQVWHYNNAALCIAGRVIEVVTGKVYEQAMREIVLEPLGMTQSFFFLNEIMTESFAVGHGTDEKNKVRVAKPWALPRSIASAGGLNSSLNDQLKYLKFHLGNGQPLFSNETLREMHTPTVPAWLGADFAVTWFAPELCNANGETVHTLKHGGSTNGQQSAFWFSPKHRFGCTILTNHDSGSFFNEQLNDWMLEHVLGLKAPAVTEIQIAQKELKALVGTYSTGDGTSGVELKFTKNKLLAREISNELPEVTVTPQPPVPPFMVRCVRDPRSDNDLLEATEGMYKGIKIELLRDASGQVSYLRAGGRLYVRQQSTRGQK